MAAAEPGAAKPGAARPRLYFGGFDEQRRIHLISPVAIEGSVEIAPGVFACSSVEGALDAVQEGLATPGDFRFFLGCISFSAGQLQREIDEVRARGARVRAFRCESPPPPGCSDADTVPAARASA